MNHPTFQPIEGAPTRQELDGVHALPDVPVVTTTYVSKHNGQPEWLLERWTDPETSEPRECWSRITASLAYVRG